MSRPFIVEDHPTYREILVHSSKARGRCRSLRDERNRRKHCQETGDCSRRPIRLTFCAFCAFDPEKPDLRGSHTLSHLRRQLSLLNGDLEIGAKTTKGTNITIWDRGRSSTFYPTFPIVKARTMTRIFIVEDHPTYREILVQSLKDVPGAEVCGVSTTAEDALETLPGLRTDLVIVDVSLPKMNGFDFAIEIRKRCPGLACLMLSGFADRGLVEQARSFGLVGYVVKGDLDELRKAVSAIMAGKSYFAGLENNNQT